MKSAYHLAVTNFSDLEAQRHSTSSGNESWKNLWRLRVIPRVKHFLWQACTNSLPTKDNLFQRGMYVDPVCALCGEGMESLFHLFLECRTIKKIWFLSPLRMDDNISYMGSFANFLWCSMHKFPQEYVELLSYIAWEI